MIWSAIVSGCVGISSTDAIRYWHVTEIGNLASRTLGHLTRRSSRSAWDSLLIYPGSRKGEIAVRRETRDFMITSNLKRTGVYLFVCCETWVESIAAENHS